jgi:hypothetical protein
VVVANFQLQPKNIGGCSLLLVGARKLGVGASLRLYLENIGGWSLLPVAAGKQRKMMLPMNVILKYI